jgi:hypothetical protein
MEVTNIDKRKIAILLSMCAVIAMVSGLYLTSYAAHGEEVGNGTTEMCRWRWRWGNRDGGSFGTRRFGVMEMSDEYKANVIAIAESDEDVQGYLTDGYIFKGVRPIIKSIIDGNSDVTTKATNAIYMLENEDTMSHIAVWVDLEAESVTKIVILTRAVIEKS